MKKDRVKNEFLRQLEKIPIIQVACEKIGVSRNSVYRWRNEDVKFRIEMEAALKIGDELVNDMSETQLVTLIREKNWNAISFWLRKRNPKFRDRIEVTTVERQDALSPEEERDVQRALEHIARPSPNITPDTYGQPESGHHSTV